MKDHPTIIPVLMSGGAGTRLWPASRPDRPKQFLELVEDRTLVRATLDRLRGLAVNPPLVVGNAAHHELISQELEAAGHDPTRMILEPLGRNTAPAAAVAALHLSAHGDDPLMFLLPADHVIEDIESFHQATGNACRLAAEGYLVTFGVVPTHPETGYGYIAAGTPVAHGASKVDRFVEKPDLATARKYLEAGNYLWNSGMFVFRCSTYLDALRSFAPEMLDACERTMAESKERDGVWLDAEGFARTPADSIDYAVMEKTTEAVVVPLDAGWNDVGSWSALWGLADRDQDGNAIIGDVITTGTSNSYIRSEHCLVTVAGLDKVVVVATPDAVLVTTTEKSQDVKKIVDILKDQARPEATRSAE